jgi:lysophospholipase L1-like esterase
MNKKRIVCFGDSNTWGYNAATNGRFDDDVRWTGVLSSELGNEYSVVEEGISGRTTVFEDPLNEGLCGIKHLFTTLISHSPLDLLIIMLGTNDTKERFSATPQNISDGIDRLIKKAVMSNVWRGEPRILIIAPIIIGEKCYSSNVAGGMGTLCVEKSRELPRLMMQCAKLNNCEFMDCNEYAKVNEIDYMHFDSESHTAFGKAVAEKVKDLFK